MTTRTTPLTAEQIARFWAKVDKSAGQDGCWPWTGGIWKGYGYIGIDRKSERAHRVAYELEHGPIAPGLVLDHTCHNDTGCDGGRACLHRRCVNPAHLEPVTDRANVLRGSGITARNAAKTHCKRGHELSGHNLMVEGTARACRICRNAAQSGKLALLEARIAKFGPTQQPKVLVANVRAEAPKGRRPAKWHVEIDHPFNGPGWSACGAAQLAPGGVPAGEVPEADRCRVEGCAQMFAQADAAPASASPDTENPETEGR